MYGPVRRRGPATVPFGHEQNAPALAIFRSTGLAVMEMSPNFPYDSLVDGSGG
jgi:hypothetical protein